MTALEIHQTPDTLHLRLPAELTITEARDLHTTLSAALLPTHFLSIDPSALTRLDVAALQVLLAAAASAHGAGLTAPSAPWTAACARLGLTDPFTQP